MIRYGKTTQTAIAAMSRLAEVYDGRQPLTSHEIARDRNLGQPLVAKLLTMLSQAGLVTGARGPGGGYGLARQPQSISLHDIAAVFERQDDATVCPFGPTWCGRRDPCPLHEDYVRFAEQFDEYLRTTRLDVFCGHESVCAPRDVAGGPSSSSVAASGQHQAALEPTDDTAG